MLIYSMVLLYFICIPIVLLGFVYRPLFGRRDALKVVFLMTIAQVYTTPWDNYIISRSAWSYPPLSILFKIYHVPIEEHLFFMLQPLLLILLHNITTLPDMIPFSVPRVRNALKSNETAYIQTLPRRLLPGAVWLAIAGFGLSILLDGMTEAMLGLQQGRGFYLGMILAWICPVIGGLTCLGARGLGRRGDRWALGLGIVWLWMVDTVAIRAGSWSISLPTSTGIELWKGLPIEEAIFFVLTSYLIILSTCLISHLHLLLLLSPPPYHPSPCPPRSLIRHITLLSKLALSPPTVDRRVLDALVEGEETLKKGSKSFAVAKLGWGREVRCGLVAVYGWCRITDNLIDEATSPAEQRDMLQMMKDFLDLVYSNPRPSKTRTLEFLNARVPKDAIASFYLFARFIVGLVPRLPFDDLVAGYEMDLEFLGPDDEVSVNGENGHGVSKAKAPLQVSPIKTQSDLILYADRVAGSVADMVCHLTWGILDDPIQSSAELDARKETLKRARQMGQALQLVNIARDVHTDALIHRVYIPLDLLAATPGDLEGLLHSPSHAPTSGSYAAYTLPLLRLADDLRAGAIAEIDRLPWTARAGTRAMVASYFEIGEELKRRKGELGAGRLKVDTWRRIWAVVGSIWGRL